MSCAGLMLWKNIRPTSNAVQNIVRLKKSDFYGKSNIVNDGHEAQETYIGRLNWKQWDGPFRKVVELVIYTLQHHCTETETRHAAKEESRRVSINSKYSNIAEAEEPQFVQGSIISKCKVLLHLRRKTIVKKSKAQNELCPPHNSCYVLARSWAI